MTQATSSRVSCILPTYNRHFFLKQSLRYFERQTWPDKELIVIDDSDQPYTGELPPDVRYIYLTERTKLGMKLNLGGVRATGSILQKWDDDDYYGDNFIRTTVTALHQSDRNDTVVALGNFLILLSWNGRIVSSIDGLRCGATMCMYRHYWKSHNFAPLPKAVDTAFFRTYRPSHRESDEHRRVHGRSPQLGSHVDRDESLLERGRILLDDARLLEVSRGTPSP